MWSESTQQWHDTIIHALTCKMAYSGLSSCLHVWRCPILAPLWQIMTLQGSGYPLGGVQSPLEGVSSGQAPEIIKNTPKWPKCRFRVKKRIFYHCAPKSKKSVFFIGLSRSVGRGLSLDGWHAFKERRSKCDFIEYVKNTFWKFYLVIFFSNFQKKNLGW